MAEKRTYRQNIFISGWRLMFRFLIAASFGIIGAIFLIVLAFRRYDRKIIEIRTILPPEHDNFFTRHGMFRKYKIYEDDPTDEEEEEDRLIATCYLIFAAIIIAVEVVFYLKYGNLFYYIEMVKQFIGM